MYVYPIVDVTDDRDAPKTLRVEVRWSGFAKGSSAMNWDGHFYGTIGPVPYLGANKGGTLIVTVVAWDTEGAMSSITGTSVTVLPCP